MNKIWSCLQAAPKGSEAVQKKYNPLKWGNDDA